MDSARIDWTAVGSVITAIATIALVIATILLFAVTRKLARLTLNLNHAQSLNQLVNLLNSSNQLVLCDDRNLRAAEEIFTHNGIDHSDESARKRWLAFVFLNEKELLYLLHLKGDLGPWSTGLWSSTSDQILERMLSHQWVMDLIETRGYHPEFVNHCRQLAPKIKIQQSKL